MSPALLSSQPLPSVDPAFDLAALPDASVARTRPALLSWPFEGFPDDRDDDFAMARSFLLDRKTGLPTPTEVAKSYWSV